MSGGAWIRCTHPDGFRSGQWAIVVGVCMFTPTLLDPLRPCFEVTFPDGTQDHWVIYDEYEPYEFSLDRPESAPVTEIRINAKEGSIDGSTREDTET